MNSVSGVTRTRNADVTGERFGRLVVVREGSRRLRGSRWRRTCVCRCDCGTEKEINRSDLFSGGSSSCGCANIESFRRVTHGKTGTAEYGIWCGMIKRCVNHASSGYRNYGARGIAVCDRWNSFENFFADMGTRPSPQHSIDPRREDIHQE